MSIVSSLALNKATTPSVVFVELDIGHSLLGHPTGHRDISQVLDQSTLACRMPLFTLARSGLWATSPGGSTRTVVPVSMRATLRRLRDLGFEVEAKTNAA
jgi:hypothetical protein